MIIDQLSNIASYRKLFPEIGRALDFLLRTDLNRLALGRHEIDHNGMYAVVMEYDTVQEAETKWESHRRFVDVHSVVWGRERIGWAPRALVRSVTAYDPVRDHIGYEGEGDWVTAMPGRFTIFFPNDAHRTGVIVNHASVHIRKVVLKIDTDRMTPGSSEVSLRLARSEHDGV